MKKLIFFTLSLSIFFSCEKDPTNRFVDTPLLNQIENVINKKYSTSNPPSLDKKNVQITSLDSLNEFMIIPFLSNVSTSSICNEDLTSDLKG